MRGKQGGYSYLNFYKALDMVPPIFIYKIIPVSFRKLNHGPEAIIQGKRNEVIVDEKQLKDLGMFRLKKRKLRNLLCLSSHTWKRVRYKRGVIAVLLQSLTSAATEWMVYEGRFQFSVGKNFLREHSKDAMGCLKGYLSFLLTEKDQTKQM